METDVQLTAFDLARASGARRGVRHTENQLSIVRQTTQQWHTHHAQKASVQKGEPAGQKSQHRFICLRAYNI